MSLATAVLLFFSGMAAGAISSVAGGASLFTFPVLLAVGLPPTVANATNFTAVLPGNAAALPAYVRELQEHRGMARRMTVTGLLGGTLGSSLLLISTDRVFMQLVPWLILSATLLYAFSGRLVGWGRQRAQTGEHSNAMFSYLLIFVVSIYGGYFGAGLGVMFLAVLALVGYSDFHAANALKNLTNTMIGLLGVLIFAVSGLIAWSYALIMMVGAALGGYAGIKLARYVPQAGLRYFVTAVGASLSVYYFWR